jgi:SAM-dependent methyltransferase
LLSARRVGITGKAYGVDATPEMVELARAHAAEANIENVEFLLGQIEDLPLPDAQVDVVISNCVINLSADTAQVVAETYRVLRPGGRLGISDVIAHDGLDAEQFEAAKRRTGCGVGTLTASGYRDLLEASGFADIRITPTVDAGGGLTSAIVRAVKPAYLVDPIRRRGLVRYVPAGIWSSLRRWRTRRSTSSRIGRTSSTVLPAGSSSSQSR